jgi:mono/diheme cytochrome c family protein
MKSVCMIAIVALLVTVPMSLRSEENGASLYKDKCAMCHGEKGEGGALMDAPALKGTKMTAEKIVEFLIKGEKGKTFHNGPFNDLSAEQAKLLADFIKSMK